MDRFPMNPEISRTVAITLGLAPDHPFPTRHEQNAAMTLVTDLSTHVEDRLAWEGWEDNRCIVAQLDAMEGDLSTPDAREWRRVADAYLAARESGTAAGTRITVRPPHGTVRAELPHTAPPSGA
jgi:hypothetical protein